ncbi:MAG: spore cortex biosynthesis protein YabQ [Bacillota bacterium]|nr:spore cortex biosynthesis protein YabQ [Bacillota bacterium]
MGTDMGGQAGVFLLCFAGGAALGLLFDAFRIIRRFFNAKAALTNICDALFWIAATIFSAYWLYTVNDGEIRWFELLAVCSGAGLYFTLLSAILVKASLFALTLIKKVLKFIIKILLYPIKAFIKISRKTALIIHVPILKVYQKVRRLTGNIFFLFKNSKNQLIKRLKKA